MAETPQNILQELESLGSESYRKILRNHGARDPLFGVKISELKKIQKRIKRDYQLALDLYDTGNYDAMYLAGLIADDKRMTKKDLQHWLDCAYCGALSDNTVAWVTAESLYGWEMAAKWMESNKESVAATGWSVLGCLVSLHGDAELDLARLKKCLRHVERTIHSQRNRVRYAMNGFVIAVGSHVKPLTQDALSVANKIGVVMVDFGNTSCAVPNAVTQIEKVKAKGQLGKKRKTVKC